MFDKSQMGLWTMWNFLIHHLKSKKRKAKTMNFQKVIYQGVLTTKPLEDI